MEPDRSEIESDSRRSAGASEERMMLEILLVVICLVAVLGAVSQLEEGD